MTISGMLWAAAAAAGAIGLWLLLKRARRGAALLRRFSGLVLVVVALGLAGAGLLLRQYLSLIHISDPRDGATSRMPSSA